MKWAIVAISPLWEGEQQFQVWETSLGAKLHQVSPIMGMTFFGTGLASKTSEEPAQQVSNSLFTVKILSARRIAA